MSNNKLGKWLKNLGFFISITIKKCKCTKNWMLILCLRPVTLLGTRLRQRGCRVNFANFFSLQLYQKRDLNTAVFLRILRNFSPSNFIKNDTLAQVNL